MTTAAQNRQIAQRLVRNLVVTLAVTAIFAFKAMDPGGQRLDPDMMTLASSH